MTPFFFFSLLGHNKCKDDKKQKQGYYITNKKKLTSYLNSKTNFKLYTLLLNLKICRHK